MRLKRSNKYNATRFKGFHSKKEYNRHEELLLLERAKQIFGLRCQMPFDIFVSGIKICTYIADFVYVDGATQDTIIEDVKGFRTPVYKLKKKLIEALYPQYKFIET